jgi:glycosyltransferase involved in cell wall biosynthesis
MSDKPLLSICIPTYNRAIYLNKTIASIVSQPEFNSGEVELIISDNASEDNTEEIVKIYQKEHENIFYYKNEENIRDKNFPEAIKRAHGTYRKLCNDTLIFRKNSIKYMINMVKLNISEKPVIFFTNRYNIFRQKPIINDFDLFIKIVSFRMTWIGGFGIWADDFNKIGDIYAGHELSLWQTKIILEIFATKKNALIDNSHLFISQDVINKNVSYDMYKIFYDNYFGLLKQYLTDNTLSYLRYDQQKKYLLTNFFIPSIIYRCFKEKNKHLIISQNENILFSNYYDKKYLLIFKIRLNAGMIKEIIKRCIKNHTI